MPMMVIFHERNSLPFYRVRDDRKWFARIALAYVVKRPQYLAEIAHVPRQQHIGREKREALRASWVAHLDLASSCQPRLPGRGEAR